MKVKCPKCSASMTYDIKTAGLKCAYCGTVIILYDGPPEEGDYTTDDFLKSDVLLTDSLEKEEEGYVNFKRLECSCCGAEMLVGESETASFCAFCGQPTLVYESISRQQMPWYIAPFLIEKEEAVARLKEKIKGKFFVSRDFKNLAIDKVYGVYVPFYRCDVRADIEGLYEQTQRSGRGLALTSYHYRRAKNIYRDILVDGSKLLDRKSSLQIGPFELDRLEGFDPVYLAGFYANSADDEIENVDQELIRNLTEYMNIEMADSVSISGNRNRDEVELLKANFNEVYILKEEPIMLPIWFVSFKKDEMVYTMMVNGQTGRCVGGVPADKRKIAFCIGVITAVLTPFLTKMCAFVLNEGRGVRLGGFLLEGAFCGLIGAVCFAIAKRSEKFGRSINRERFANDRNGGED